MRRTYPCALSKNAIVVRTCRNASDIAPIVVGLNESRGMG